LELPASVVTVTETLLRWWPSCGIVTSQRSRAGHRVGTGWLSTRASTWPVRGLTKPLPWSETVVPGPPRAGDIEARRGRPPDLAGGAVVVVVLVLVVLGLVVVLGRVVLGLVRVVLGAGLLVVEARGSVGTAAPWLGAGDGWRRPSSRARSAAPSSTARAATAAMVRISQRGTETALALARVAEAAGGPPGVTTGTGSVISAVSSAPVAARARRTASASASVASWLGGCRAALVAMILRAASSRGPGPPGRV
jgi:hypothetical protein